MPRLAALSVMGFIAAAIGLCLYSGLEDLRLGGMPRKYVEMHVRPEDRQPLFAAFRAFATDHGLGLDEVHDPGSGAKDYFGMSRWDVGIRIWSESSFGCGQVPCAVDAGSFNASIAFKGWLWWTPPGETEDLANDLVARVRRVNPRATVTVRTFAPPR